MDFSDIIQIVFDSNQRIVLVEKAPFLVHETLIRGRYYMVRRITEVEWQRINEVHIENKIKNSKNELYRVIDFGLKGFPTNNEYDIGCIIYNKHCELIKSFSQLKPVRKNETITVWE